jgi:hypothetical protein
MKRKSLLWISCIGLFCSNLVFADKSEVSIDVGAISNSTSTIIGKLDGNLTINMQQSGDYQSLLAIRDKAQKDVAKYPNDPDFKLFLKKAQKELDDFTRDVVKLADEITRFPINTERLRLAKEFFDRNNYKAARDTFYRQLAHDNPAVFLPGVANTLYAFGFAYFGWNEPQKSLPLLQESAELLAPFAKKSPSVFGSKHALILQLIEQAKGFEVQN